NEDNIFIDDRLYEITKKLPDIMRKNDGEITAYFQKNNNNWNIFDIEEGNKTKKIFGLAIDIGTTTIVGYLINLLTGETSSLSAMLNPQTAIGEDLVSRITYIKKNNAINKAKKLIIDAINKIIEDCCTKSKIDVIDVKDIVIVGNTGIYHMFFGIPSEYLAVAPFVPVFKAPINISAKNLGIKCNPNINVYSPPVIAGYVGTDTTGCIVSSRIDQYDKFSILIDIGTNGEIVIGNKKSLVTGSCAAGSALEGAHIKAGMRAAEGSIERVVIDRDSLDPTLGIIGDEIAPVGICGSGLIDVVAELLRSKVICQSGRFNVKAENLMSNKRIIKKGNKYNYILYKEEWDAENIGFNSSKETEIKEILISQEDIRQIQLAKGAFLTGSNILLDYEKKEASDVEQVILAGAFGTYITKKNAAFIGLFPDVPSGKIFQIGNAAGLGAQLCLKNTDSRDHANDIANKLKYYEIASSPLFQKEYAYSLYFPYHNIEKFPSLKEEYENIPFR
ncbi:MAG: ATP-binding protein, partial [archaeon]|nr:ATP-binding protein [archaeon]